MAVHHIFSTFSKDTDDKDFTVLVIFSLVQFMRRSYQISMSPLAQRQSLIFLLWLVGLGAAAQFAKIAIPFGIVRELYPNVGDGVGWLLSIISLLGVIFGIAVGGFVARLGEKHILMLGLFLGALMSLWQVALPSFNVMLFTRLIEGMSHLAIVVAAPSVIAQLADDRFRPLAMSFWSTFFGVGFAIFAWVILPFLNEWNLPNLFTAHAVYMAVMAILLWALLPSSVVNPNKSRGTDMIATHLRAYTTPNIAAPSINWFFYTLTFVALLAVLPEHLPTKQAAWAIGLMPILSIFSALVVVPILIARFGTRTVVTIGFSLGAIAALSAIPFESRAIVMVVFFGIIGLIQGAGFAIVPELNRDPDDQAIAYGFMAQMGNFGNLIGTPLFLFIIGLAGDVALFVAVPILYLLALTAHFRFGRTASS